MFTGFKRQAEHLARTVSFFREKCGLAMRDARGFGGYANLRLPRTAVQGDRPIVGEQAGFQDALAGFGLRYAFRSAVLAAQSVADGASYARLWRASLLPLLRAGVVNRFLFNATGARGRRYVLGRFGRTDARRALGRLYGPSLLGRLLYPLAWLRYRAPLADPSCDHVDCGCVWCQCAAAEAGRAPGSMAGKHGLVGLRT
jgi:flavin-dependent dehydrogenase